MEQTPEWLAISIVLAPLILFTVTIIIFFVAVNRNGLKLIDILSEPVKKEKDASGNPTSTEKRSASRFILFLTGVVTLVLTSCFTTYYFFMKIYTVGGPQDLDLSGFTNVLLALGIGVIPYSVNQVKNAKL